MAKSIIVHGRPDWGMAEHAEKLRQHFGLKHVVIDFDGKFHEEENFLYIAYCYLPGCTPATMRVMSYQSAADEYNSLIPLTDWQSGPPPMVGEWNATFLRSDDARRWWDGESWSNVWHKKITIDGACFRASQKSANQNCIFWRGLSQEPIKVTE